MYAVEQEEPSETFKRAWASAGRHLGPQGGDGFNWLRANLNPPMAEHLSFRLGNQLFFVFVEAAEFAFERWRDLFLEVSHEAHATPCRMPMTERLIDYEPAFPGWGLIHAETQQPVNPADMVSNELIEMSDWELHDFAIQIVKAELTEEGKNVFSAQSSRKIDPSIWFEDNGARYWVVVREVRLPEEYAAMPTNIDEISASIDEISASCSRKAQGGYFASVKVANSDDPFDLDASSNGNFLPLYRGHRLKVGFKGLKRIT